MLQHLRKRNCKIPVLILTARGTLEDRVRGLDLGADDYLTKPFDFSELEARVRALLRRVFSENSNELVIGSLCFDIKGQRVTVGGNPLEISAREMRVLETLLRRAGSVVSKEQILESLCNWNEDVSDNAIEVYIHRLRKKLGNSGVIIRTIRGLGYLLDILIMNKNVTLRRKLLTWLLLPMLVLWLMSAAVMHSLAFKFVNYAYDYSLLDSTHDLCGTNSQRRGQSVINLPKSALQMFLSDELDDDLL